ncbi:MAG TPA: L,D-transpeptidase family protein [Pseudomonadales bacterium]|nr:L,D-transpeptidase family protein [Pseudomonadales bacterium]
MLSQSCSRREFLKLSYLMLLSLGFALPNDDHPASPVAMGRVTVASINIYQQPSYRSDRVGKAYRDQILNLLEEKPALDSSGINPRWYRNEKGYINSAYIQQVKFKPPNKPLASIPEQGVYGEVTIPIAQTYWEGRNAIWQPLYRLYYESVHWIREVVERQDRKIWYRLFDPKNDSTYYVPAAALRPIDPTEFSPTARDVSPNDKRIVISIAKQTVTAYEGEKIVLHTSISSGLPEKNPVEGEIPTDTPKGFFRITQKMPSRHMGDGHLTNKLDAYELPGVPWTMAFHKTGVAMHGSYWHDNFGHPMSHGCINMRNADALWLFRWSDPVYDPSNWYVNGLGTLVQVF